MKHPVQSIGWTFQLSYVCTVFNSCGCSGLQVRTGGTKLPDVGPNFFAPTVLTDVPTTALVRYWIDTSNADTLSVTAYHNPGSHVTARVRFFTFSIVFELGSHSEEKPYCTG